MKLFLSIIFFVSTFSCLSQCTDTLKLKNFPCCVSGIDWSETEQRLFIVSDMHNLIYIATVNIDNRTSQVIDSIRISNSPHNIGLEAIRKTGNTFYFTYEKDEDLSGNRTATAFISKGILKNGLITIVKNIEIKNLPVNKGLEGLAISEDKKSILVAHETMAKPRNGLDSVKIIQLDTNLNIQNVNWHYLPQFSFFDENRNAYNDYGITEILNIKDTIYILERGYGKLKDNPQLFINLTKAPLSNLHKKISVYSFKATPLRSNCVDNYEGMSFLKNANKLLVISDDNRNKKYQRTILLLLTP